MVTININQTDTTAFNYSNFIQVDAKDKLLSIVGKFISKDRTMGYTENPLIFERVHNCIMVNGRRGTGKTSFILSLLNFEFRSHSEVCALPIIDPSLAESRENILINIIVLMQERVMATLNSVSGMASNQYNLENAKETWEKSLQHLAQSIGILEGVGSEPLQGSAWDDPLLVFEKGLHNAKSGQQLETRFHAFIEISLKILNKRAFMLIFDDIDTSLNEGRKILEILRKYLTSPQLITVMLGDIELYSTIIRQLKWEKLDSNGTLRKYEDLDNFNEQIDHLEDQYLTKILKPENRINLQTLNELELVKIVTDNEQGTDSVPTEINEFIHNIIAKLLDTHPNSKDIRVFSNCILNASLRSVLQLLNLLDRAQKKPQSSQIQTLYSESIRDAFYTILKISLKNSTLLERPSKHNFIEILSDYLLSEFIKNTELLSMRPKSISLEADVRALYINALFRQHISTADYLVYLVKVNYLLQISLKLDKEDPDYLDKDLRQSINNSQVSCLEMSHKMLISFGNLRGARSMIRAAGGVHIPSDIVADMPDCIQKLMFVSALKDGRERTNYAFSVFNFIAFLADLLSTDNVDQMLAKNARIIGYSTLHSRLNEVSPLFLEKELSPNSGYFNLNKGKKEELIRWVNAKNQIKHSLNAIDLEELWHPLFENIEAINQQNKNAIHLIPALYKAAILNAFFIVCSRKSGQLVSDLRNPVTEVAVFEKKLATYGYLPPAAVDDCVTFFDFLYLCPALSDMPENLIPVAVEQQFPDSNEPESKVDLRQKSHEEVATLLEPEILAIDGWRTLTASTIATRLRRKFRPVSEQTVSDLIIKLSDLPL